MQHYTIEDVKKELRATAAVAVAEYEVSRCLPGSPLWDPTRSEMAEEAVYGYCEWDDEKNALEQLKQGNKEPAKQLFHKYIFNLGKLTRGWQPTSADLVQKVTLKDMRNAATKEKQNQKHLIRLYQLLAALS